MTESNTEFSAKDLKAFTQEVTFVSPADLFNTCEKILGFDFMEEVNIALAYTELNRLLTLTEEVKAWDRETCDPITNAVPTVIQLLAALRDAGVCQNGTTYMITYNKIVI